MFSDRAEQVFIRTEVGLANGAAISTEQMRALRKCRTQLRTVLITLGKSKTVLDQMLVWQEMVSTSLSRSQKIFSNLSSRSTDTRTREIGLSALKEICTLDRDINRSLNDPKYLKRTRQALMRFQIMPFKSLRQHIRIFDQRALEKFEISLELDLTNAALEWFLLTGPRRKKSLINAINESQAPFEKELVRLFIKPIKKC